MRSSKFRTMLLAGCAGLALSPAFARAQAAERTAFNIPAQDLGAALTQFGQQSEREIVFSADLTRNRRARPVTGEMTTVEALTVLLADSGLSHRTTSAGAIIVEAAQAPQSGSAAGGGAEVEALIVTAQKREEDIQDVPIAISAFTQEQLERSQVAGGPDLMTQVPNMTFTKTNFSSYSIQIRGIGTQAISATTDPAVAVAFNNTPFVRNRFFEQEFYDLQRVEVLRGPQGTLYGRNATAGVVNLITQKPRLSGFEAKVSADLANYNSSRIEGMINLPLVDDAVALRLAGAWTKREGYSTNEITGNPIDGRDLWSTRVSLRLSPGERFDANFIWEHFEENDDRLRSGKQLCHQDDREMVSGLQVDNAKPGEYVNAFSQGCIPASLYSSDSFEAPNGWSIPYFKPLSHLDAPINDDFNPYSNLVQSRDLRVIESTVDPEYTAETDIVQLQMSYDLINSLTVSSETAYSQDNIFSKQDYNRFNTASGAFDPAAGSSGFGREDILTPGPNGWVFCDPQVGCADRLVVVDVSTARSRQFSQELRLSSDFDGPFNFSVGGNFLRYDTEEKYYVFINTLTLWAAQGWWFVNNDYGPWIPGATDNHECLDTFVPVASAPLAEPSISEAQTLGGCIFIDPNPIGSLNDLGHNYFLSKNPYKLMSYALFGEAYYNIAENLKLTAGLRWTVDKKEAPRIPSWVLAANTVGYPVSEIEEQEWKEPTGRLTLDWKPDLSFTDDSLLYASVARGYKAGGSNPPPSGVVTWLADIGEIITAASATKPRTFDPEFVTALELGSKNTLADSSVTLNLAAFYYDYDGYQISQIIDRSAVNYNFDAKVWGLEIEADWRPLENLRLGFKGGYENTRVAGGESAVDVMDRTAGHDDWVVVRPFPTYTSNCIVPAYILDVGAPGGQMQMPGAFFANGVAGPCEYAYSLGVDPITNLPYEPDPTLMKQYVGGTIGPLDPLLYPNYPGYDPSTAPNNGEGFSKDLSGNELPNAPHFTATITADYTVPLPNDWLATLHTDLYYQSEAWTRIFNMEGYDKLKAYTNVNLAAIFTNEALGWKVMAYVKNVFDRDSITGAFLNSDDTGLTTNVFLTEPRLYGLRVTKEWNGAGWWTNSGRPYDAYPFAVELGGMLQQADASYDPVQSGGDFSGGIDPALAQNGDLDLGHDASIKLTYSPSDSWRVSAQLRYGKVKGVDKRTGSQLGDSGCWAGGPKYPGGYDASFYCENPYFFFHAEDWSRTSVTNTEEHMFVDFGVGREFGLGTLSVGLRYAELESRTVLDLQGVPDWDIPEEWAFVLPTTYHYYDTDLIGRREFQGIGPTVTWEGSHGILDNLAGGVLEVEGELGAGLLFGKQETSVDGVEYTTFYSSGIRFLPLVHAGPRAPTDDAPEARSKSTTVSTAAAELGLSYSLERFKLRAGYRWERYFDVLDAGFAQREEYDRTMDGPYLRFSVGFGG